MTSRRRSFLPWALLAVAAPLLAVADDAKPAAQQALRVAEEPLRDRDWGKAATALRDVRTRFPGTPEAVEAWVLEARALFLAGQAREALDAATGFLQANGDAAWAGRMKATMADAYAAVKAEADETRVLRERAEFLTGDDHRAKLAALYVTLGDGDFDGREGKDDLGRPVKKTDFPLALQAYARAIEIGVAPADLLRVRARVAEAFEKVGDFAKAAGVWDRLVKSADQGPGADPEAWLVGRARARLRAGQGPEARKDLRDALETYPQGKRHLEILRLLAEERLAFAAAHAGTEDGMLAFDEGVQLLRRAIAEHRDAPAAPDVQRSLAEAYAGRGEWQKAAAEWRGLVERYPTHAAAPEWRNALALALASAGRFDDAVAEWKAFLSAFPNHPLWQQVQDAIPEAKWNKGVALAAQNDVDGAIAAFRAFAEEYATHENAPVALLQVGALLRGRKDFEGAVATWRGVTGRYAGAPAAPQAWLLLAETLEDDLGRLEDAVKEYEELLKKHPQVAEAQQRLTRLKGKHLEVRGERVIGTADAAVLKVLTRNVPSLKVRVYKLGLEDYFRRKQTIGGVEAVQVEIVKPDATAEWKVEPYAPFALVQAERPVPVTGPGAYVIVAGDDDLTSTTLLIVSDVEAVVKAAAGRQVFVWARDRATGTPVEGARVLVTDGSTVFTEGVTGKDGVWQVDSDHAARGVLVLSPKGAASSEWQPGQTYAEGWQPKAHVSTDRPVYRPGQKVEWRAIYRRADGGGYHVVPDLEATVYLLNARGAEVEHAKVKPSATGVYHGTFALDGAAPLGDWTVRLDVDGRSFPGVFRVLEYRKPEFTLSVDPVKPSYRTGDTVEAKIRLKYAFGGSVVGAPVEWQVTRMPHDFTPSAVNDYSWYFQDPEALERARVAARSAVQGTVVARGTAKTDDHGEASLSFPTTERDEDAEYVVQASAMDVTRRSVADEGRIPVVRRDHWAVVTTDKRVYRPKQEVRATIQTVDANQSPVSKAGEVLLVRVKRGTTPMPMPPKPGTPPPPNQEDAKRGGLRVTEEEIEVQKLPVTTDAKGRAEVRLVVPAPGTYRVRWNSTDARGAIVTAAATVDVSGEAEDLTKEARLVASKESYVEGETAEVLLQSPVTKVKALLTFEGEKVLAYRLIDVDGTSTMLDVPVDGLYAPNVTLKIAIPAREKLLEADDDIVVFRYLNVAVAPSKAVAAPGEDVSFEVTTTDAAGKPVTADVGVSVVDEALYAVAPDRTPAIRPYFYDRKRVDRVVTSSSVGFRTYGTTRETNKDLLANAEARDGDPNRLISQNALRLARAALESGDLDTAVGQALAASAADPSSWDARNLVSELRSRGDAQESLKKYDDAKGGEMRKALDEARAADAAPALDRPGHAWKSKDGAAPPRALAPAPSAAAPQTPGEGGAESKDAELLDRNELAGEPEKGADGDKAVVGTGGGGGGTFKGRGGMRRMSTHGGVAAAAGDRLNVMLAESADRAQSDAGLESQYLALSLQNDLAQAEVGKMQAMLAQAQARTAFGFANAPAIEPALRKTFADTALFEPSVVTDATGKATVKLKLPDNLTRWRATARGISGDSLVGEGRGGITARKEVLLRVDAPRFLVQGDEATIPSAVHNESGTELTAKVTMTAEGATLGGEDGSLVVPAGGRAIKDRPLAVKTPGAVRLTAEAVAAQGGDKVEVAFGAAARGLRTIDGRSGTISSAKGNGQDTFLEVAEGSIPGTTSLTVVLYPGYDAAIVDALTYLDLYPYGCVEQTVHRFLPAAWARRALTAVGSPDAKRLEELDRVLAASVARLGNLASDDGSFGWWRGGTGNVAMTAMALLGLREAAVANVPGAQDAVNRTAAALRRIVRSAPDDVQALGHWALASAGQLDEEAYQITFRRRNEELSVVGLSYLALAAKTLGREFDGDELVRLLLSRRTEDADTTKWSAKAGECLLGSERLATALAVRALIELGSADAAGERGMRWLLAHRIEGGFGTTMETAAFVGACAAWMEKARPTAFSGKITVVADGVVARTVEVKAGSGLAAADRRFAVDVAGWKPGRHALTFQLAGQGEVAWAARLETVVASEALAADEHGVKVERFYLDPELPPIEGAEMPVKPGYEILRPAARPKIEAKNRDRAVPGERMLVRVLVTAPRDLQYVLVEDPLPAGFEVLDGTAAGPFDWQERRDDRQVFFLSNVKAGSVALTYVLQAVHLGQFTALPSRAYAMYLPEVHGNGAGQRMTVAEGPAKGGDVETPPTPDEVYAAGQKMLGKKQWADAAKTLGGLKALALRDEIVVEIEAALLRCAIETKDVKEIVRTREELVRRQPAKIPSDLASQRAIAAAYADLGAFAVASGLFRDLVARSFGYETGWSETLKTRGRELEGMAALAEALKAYPVANATSAAALQRATRFRDLRRPEGQPGKAGAPMLEEGLEALRDVSAQYAETTLAGPTSYAIVEALRRVRDLDGAVAEATAFPRRFPDSPFVDDTLFFLMDSHLQKFEAAPSAESAKPVLDAAKRLIDESFRRPDGNTGPSEFRPRAFHALGRVRHVLGDLSGAIEAYREAAGQIEDAREALAYLTEARLELRESVTSGVSGAASFPVRYRNVSEIRFKAYPVDLQVLFAMRRTLEGLNRIDLSGIAPAQEWTLSPKDGQDHAWHDASVELPAGKDAAGVYLVVAKAGNLEASTVVLKTDLQVVLQPVGEKVRVNVTGPDGRGVRGAYVTVSDGQAIKARGMTDGRGVFEAPGVGTKPFVVVNLGERYAISR